MFRVSPLFYFKENNMPSSPGYKRNYKQEYANYQGKPEQIKNRSARNSARSTMEAAGKVHKGDGKDVDHKKPLSKGGSNSKSNLRAVSASANRSYKRTSSGKVK
jgi:HNH endonuclease